MDLVFKRLINTGFVVRQRYFNDRSESHPIYGVVVYADWTKPPALAGGWSVSTYILLSKRWPSYGRWFQPYNGRM